MTVGIDIDHTAKLVQLFYILCHKWADPAGKNVDNGIFYFVFLDIFAAVFKCCYIIPNCLGRSNVGDVDVEAPGIVVGGFKIFRIFAGYVISQLGMVLVILGQFIYEGFIAAVSTGDALGANDEYMFHIKT